jgi:hypothetical protein
VEQGQHEKGCHQEQQHHQQQDCESLVSSCWLEPCRCSDQHMQSASRANVCGNRNSSQANYSSLATSTSSTATYVS